MAAKKNLKATKTKNIMPSTKEYVEFLVRIKDQIQNAQIKAALAANKELIKLYWTIGKDITEKQLTEGWGTNFIENLSKDLQNAFPGIGGFSRANIFNMRAFYLAYEKVQQPARLLEDLPIFNIPWWHNVILINKVKDRDQRLWYAQKAIEYGWSRPFDRP